MFRCNLPEENVGYTSESIKAIGQQLDNYLVEMYGKYTIIDENSNELRSCKNIKNKGNYIITVSNSYTITCIID